MLSNTTLTPWQKVLEGLSAEGFWWMTGFEGSNIPQIEADEYEWTQHYSNWTQDLALVRHKLGVRYLRYTLPWQKLNPASGYFEWDWADRLIDWAERLGLELVANPIHFGTPLWLKDSFGNPDFPQYAAEVFSQLAHRYRDRLKFYTPHNEPLITALFGGDFGHWPPYWEGHKNYVKLLTNICRQIVLSVEAVRAELPEAVMIHVDAGEYYATHRSEAWLHEEVQFRNERRFLGYDLISGRVGSQHRLRGWLEQQGVEDNTLAWFQRRAIELDVVGVDFYPHCEVWLDIQDGEIVEQRDHGHAIIQAFAASGDSKQVSEMVNLPISLSGLLRQYYERYQRPIMLTETDYCGQNDDKVLYMQYGVQEIRRLRESGVPVLGYTWWPALDHLNWDKALKERGHIHPVGLWELVPDPDGRLERVETSAVQAFQDLVTHPQAAIGTVVT